MAADANSLEAELPEILELLANAAGFVGGLDLTRAGEIEAESLTRLRDGLLRAGGFLRSLFDLRGEPAPAPEPGVAFSALGPSLKRTLPQRLAAQLTDDLNAVLGSGLEGLSEFAALGLFARVSDLLRFVAFVEETKVAAARRAAPPTIVSTRRAARAAVDPNRAEAPSTAVSTRRPAPHPPRSTGGVRRPSRERTPEQSPQPPVPDGPGPDLTAYDIRIDEQGERVDEGRLSVWFAASAGPRAAGPGLSAAFAVPFAGGVALAVAEGAESSLGARLAAVVAVRTFCRAAAASPAAAGTAVRTAQQHLDMLLSALLSAGDASDAFAKVRGAAAPANARRILAHTRNPEEALRRVAPALTTGLVGAVAFAARGGYEVSAFRLGPGSAELRTAGRIADVFGPSPPGGTPLLGPGPRGADEAGRVEAARRLALGPGDALLLGTPALAKGATSAWTSLAAIWPSFPQGLATGDSARDLLRRAERWGEAEPPSFGGPLGLALLLAR